MIKEAKVNMYRVVRSKSFYVIVILLLLGAILSSLFLKFCADDPFGFFKLFREEMLNSATEEERPAFEVTLQSIDTYRNMNNLTGVLRLSVCNELVCFLHCTFVALFVAGEFKSRVHVNHYSLTSHPERIVFTEWLTLMGLIVLVEAVCYGVSLGIAVWLCNSFSFSDAYTMFVYSLIMIAVLFAHSSFAFMISYIRKASPLAIVLSSLFTLGVFDIVFALVSIWVPWVRFLALNSIVSNIGLMSMQNYEKLASLLSATMYTAVFLGITLFVAAKRDPY